MLRHEDKTIIQSQTRCFFHDELAEIERLAFFQLPAGPAMPVLTAVTIGIQK